MERETKALLGILGAMVLLAIALWGFSLGKESELRVKHEQEIAESHARATAVQQAQAAFDQETRAAEQFTGDPCNPAFMKVVQPAAVISSFGPNIIIMGSEIGMFNGSTLYSRPTKDGGIEYSFDPTFKNPVGRKLPRNSPACRNR